MPANKMTLKAVDAILQADFGVSAVLRGNILRDLGRDEDTQCGEAEAARLLDISSSTLYHWRKGEWSNAPHPFWFHTWENPLGQVRYDIAQLRAYTALRKAVCNKDNPQPTITATDVSKFQNAMGEH